MRKTFVIAGAGQAGGWVARTLRQEGFEGRVVLVGAESHMPYERPPLSKSALTEGTYDLSKTVLGDDAAREADIEVRLGTSLEYIDRQSRTVHLSDGTDISYDRLFLTTGSSPRRPDWLASDPGSRIHQLRTRDEAERLHVALSAGGRLLIVGGGWIGLEVAASARSLGLDVMVFEAGERICARSLPAEISDFLVDLHSANGVRIVTRAGITGVSETPAGVTLHLSDGTAVAGDHVLVGIGNVPNVGLAMECGLDVANGIVVDSSGRTSDPNIFAAGDVTSQPCSLSGDRARRESWANAQNQAIAAARAALGQSAVHDEIPWIWSDQFDVNLQILGIPERARRLIKRPGPGPGSACWLALDHAGVPIGAVSANAPRQLRAARKLISAGDTASLGEWA